MESGKARVIEGQNDATGCIIHGLKWNWGLGRQRWHQGIRTSHWRDGGAKQSLRTGGHGGAKGQWSEKAVVGQGNLVKLHRSQWRRKVQRTVWRVWSRDVHKSLSWSPSQV